MISKSVIYTIDLYQKYLSPYKGYCCAYKVYHNDISYSEFTKSIIKDLGFFQAIALIKQRFKDCKISSEKIKNVVRVKVLKNLVTHAILVKLLLVLAFY